MQRVLMINSIWPEPHASASGVRTWQWIQFFQRWGSTVKVVSPGNDAPGLNLLKEAGVETASIALNRSESGKVISDFAPDLIIFDRFIVEEQFGFLAQKYAPQAMRVLETQDLHFLRKSRQPGPPLSASASEELAANRWRELSSIARSDVTTVVSSFEETLLCDHFGFKREQVRWIPFLYPDPIRERAAAWTKVPGEAVLVWIGNFRHAPNREGLDWFLKKVYPRIMMRQPQVRFRIGGAFPTKEIVSLVQGMKSVEFVGEVDDLDAFFADCGGHSAAARLNIAALNFGAGIKGKILEGWRRGIPCISTAIGAEGYSRTLPFGGLVADTENDFADACLKLLSDDQAWIAARDQGRAIMEKEQALSVHELGLREFFLQRMSRLEIERNSNWVGRALELSLNRSTEYFSKWIELKERSLDPKHH